MWWPKTGLISSELYIMVLCTIPALKYLRTSLYHCKTSGYFKREQGTIFLTLQLYLPEHHTNWIFSQQNLTNRFTLTINWTSVLFLLAAINKALSALHCTALLLDRNSNICTCPDTSTESQNDLHKCFTVMTHTAYRRLSTHQKCY